MQNIVRQNSQKYSYARNPHIAASTVMDHGIRWIDTKERVTLQRQQTLQLGL